MIKQTINYKPYAIPYTPSQKGFSPVILLITLAIVIVVGGIIYGYFIMTGKTQPAPISTQPTTVQLTEQDPLQPLVGTPECPELDYTGCDTTGEFMTWDGE